MNYKKEIVELLDELKKAGFSRKDIEGELEYSSNYITQQLSKGGNEKLYKAILKYRKQHLDNMQMTDSDPLPYLEQRRAQKNNHVAYMVPLIPVKAQAGYVRAIDQEFYLDTLEKYALPPGIQPQGATWAYWEIQGDSMEPNFMEGDIILTSLMNPMDWQELRNFYVHVVVLADQVCIKRIFRKNTDEWVLISDNEDQYEQKLINIADVRQVWLYRKTWASRAKPPKMFEIKV